MNTPLLHVHGIEVYDTTLRDGSQGAGINFSAADKMHVAQKLDEFGIPFIEGGYPGSNPKDMEFFERAKKHKWKTSKLVAFGMTRRKGKRVEDDELIRQLLDTETPAVAIVGKSWRMHVEKVLQTTPEENLAMIADTVRFFKDHGKTVVYDAEHAFDGYKADQDYALQTWFTAKRAGADCICLCDTNGGSLPDEVECITAMASSALRCHMGVHTHNDCGLALANALAGLKGGAMQVQGTVNGYGERTGNCNLTSLIPILQLKWGRAIVPKESMPKLRELSFFVDEIANIRPDPRQPWVGTAAFAHKGGMHAHAVGCDVKSYEHIAPEAVGNSRKILVSDMAGRANIVQKAAELGVHLHADTPLIRTITAHIKDLEHEGFEFEAADASLFLLIKRKLGSYSPLFTVDRHHVSVTESVCEATIKVCHLGKVAHRVAEGDGPVNALDKALRLALREFFPKLDVQLVDYKVRTIDNGVEGSAAKTRVLITSSDGKREWGTVGLHTNVITASLQALTDSMHFALSQQNL